jgi:hypothetical protein
MRSPSCRRRLRLVAALASVAVIGLLSTVTASSAVGSPSAMPPNGVYTMRLDRDAFGCSGRRPCDLRSRGLLRRDGQRHDRAARDSDGLRAGEDPVERIRRTGGLRVAACISLRDQMGGLCLDEPGELHVVRPEDRRHELRLRQQVRHVDVGTNQRPRQQLPDRCTRPQQHSRCVDGVLGSVAEHSTEPSHEGSVESRATLPEACIATDASVSLRLSR